MDILPFTFLLILSSVSFFGFFIIKEQDGKIIFSILSTILFYLSAVASFAIEQVFVVGSTLETHLYSSYTFAGVCGLFGTLSLVFSFITIMSLFKKPRSDEI